MSYGFASVATFGQNLQRLRERAGFIVSKLENDQQGLPEGPTLIRLAKVLKCSVDELLEGVDADYQTMLIERAKAAEAAVGEADKHEAEPIDEDVRNFQPDDIPLIQEGDASPEGLVWDGEAMRLSEAPRTSRPYDFRESGAYAVVLRGDSMEPLLKRGMRLIISPTQRVTDGDLVYAQLRSGERLAKIATRQANGWLLTSANPSYPPRFVTVDEIEHIHKVAYVRFLK